MHLLDSAMSAHDLGTRSRQRLAALLRRNAVELGGPGARKHVGKGGKWVRRWLRKHAHTADPIWAPLRIVATLTVIPTSTTTATTTPGTNDDDGLSCKLPTRDILQTTLGSEASRRTGFSVSWAKDEMATVASARRSPQKSTPAETWDEDFEFSRQDLGHGGHHFNKENNREKVHRRGMSYDNERTDKVRWNAPLGGQVSQDWPEPGPSRTFVKMPLTPTSTATSSPRKPPNLRARVEEGDDDNWDDDFVDKLDSPARTHPRTPHSQHKSSPRFHHARKPSGSRRQRVDSPSPTETPENWDEDFEMASTMAGSVQASPASKRSRDASEAGTNWDYSSDEGEESDFGREIIYEEDKTVTAHARRRPLTTLPPMPLPLLDPQHTMSLNHIHIPDPNQVAPHPRSPTISVFSIPATITTASGRDSVMFGSTAHLAIGLRRTHSAGSSSMGFGQGHSAGPNLLRRYPAPQPVPRERRRLRKKSRPPRLDGDVMELEDVQNVTAASTGRPGTASSSADGDPVTWRTQTPPPGGRSSMSAAMSPASAVASLSSPGSVAARGTDSSVGSAVGNVASGSGSTAPATAIDANVSAVGQGQVNPPPTSGKSPLLSRIGSMKRWGARRKRASGTAQAGDNGMIAFQPVGVAMSSSSASGRASEDFDESEEHSRTPRASMNTNSSGMGLSPRGTPASATGRFFRSGGGAGAVEPLALTLRKDLEGDGDESGRGLVLKREGSKEREKDGGVLGSPTKARIRALGSRFRPGGGKGNSSSGSAVADVGDANKDGDADGDVTMTIKNINASRAHARSSSPSPAPQSRRYSQLPPQVPSMLSRPSTQRHVSGPASSAARAQAQDIAGNIREVADGKAAADEGSVRGTLSAAGMLRSVSGGTTSTSNGSASIGSAAGEKIAASKSNSNSSDGHGKEGKEKDGGRGFMGSMRRISLVGGGQKKHKRSKSGGVEGDTAVVVAPALPTPAQTPHSVLHLLPAQPLLPPLDISLPSALTTATRPLVIDLASPIEPPVSSSVPMRNSMARIPPMSSTAIAIHTTSRRPSEPTLSHSKSSSFATSLSTRSSSGTFAQSAIRASPVNIVSRLGSGSPGQVNSLGRAAHVTGSALGTVASSVGAGVIVREGSPVPRRNSLGDLKIPTRISRVQDGLKRDLTRVKEFAAHVEQMKELRWTYFTLIAEIQSVIDSAPPPSRAATPLFHLTRPPSRTRSNTNPPPPQIEQRRMMIAFQTIDSKYRIAWECADLLIDLGSGAIGENASPNKGNASLPAVPTLAAPGAGGAAGAASLAAKGRERAITLAGDEGKPALNGLHESQMGPPQASPPPHPSWRASTGRNDLNSRQLYLLKEMLNNGDSVKDSAKLDLRMYGDDSSRAPTPWMGHMDGMESSLTLPTEESEMASASSSAPATAKAKDDTQAVVASPFLKKRKGPKLGMAGLRDMLRSLKRNQFRATSESSDTHTAEAGSTESSVHSHVHPHPYGQTLPLTAGRLTGRKRSKTSMAPESVRSTSGNDYPGIMPFMSGNSLTHQPQHKSSPRRPSLASLFRLGQKHKANGGASANSTDQSLDQTVEAAAAKELKETATAVFGLDACADANRSHSTTSTAEDDDDESDWDRMDSTSDINVPMDVSPSQDGEKSATLKGRGKRLIRRRLDETSSSGNAHTGKVSKSLFNAFGNTSQGSFRDSPDNSLSQIRSPRLSNVDENGVSSSHSGHQQTPSSPCVARELRAKGKEKTLAASKVRPTSAGGPKSSGIPDVDVQPIPDLKLAMTPENIKPLLENARVVTSQLTECITETRGLLASNQESKTL